MIVLFLKSLGVHFRAGRTLFLLSLFGVALGVASVLSIQIIVINALGAFAGSVRAISGDADLSVLGRGPTISESLYPEVLSTEGVVAAWPVYRVEVVLAGQERFYLTVLGLDLFAAARVPWETAPIDPGEPLRRPGWAAVSPVLADRFAWSQGDTFVVGSGSRRVELNVGALVDFRRITPMASDRLVVMDIAQAQHLFGGRGRIHQIDIDLGAGVDSAAVASRLGRQLGPTVRVQTPRQRQDAAAGLLGAFRLNLTALSLVSVFVGAFLVYSATQASLVRRRNEFGLLRSLGAGRGQVVSLILAEVGLLGLLGTILGIPLGYAVARANVDRVGETLSNLYLLEQITTLRLPPWIYLVAVVVGVGAAVAGALLPALEISRSNPRALLAAYDVHQRMHSGATRLLVAGLLILTATGSAWLVFGRAWRPGGFVLAVALLVGLPLMAPWLVREATRHLEFRRFGIPYGIKALGLRLQTTAFAVAALGVAVSLLIGVTLMIGSFRRTVEIWIHDTLRADVYVTTESWSRARSAATLGGEVVEALASHPGVDRIDRLRQFFVYSQGRRVSLVGVDMGLRQGQSRFALLEGDPDEVFLRVREEGAVIVSEPLSRKAGLRRNETLRVEGPNGVVRFPIAGISYDYSDESGGAAMDLSTMESAFGPGPINNVALYLEDGAEAEAVVDELKSRFADRPLLIRSNRTLREEVFRIFDQTFAVTRLLQAMSLLIAVCGVTLTLIVLARERVSELALYRSLGATRPQIFRVFLGKGLGMAIFGLALGVPGGAALAMILIFLINRAYFGWTIAVHWPWIDLSQEVSMILAAAALASLYPAFRASRTPATELSRENL